MAVYHFKAKDRKGSVESGLMHGSSMEQVTGRLAQQGLEVIEVESADPSHDPIPVPEPAPAPTQAPALKPEEQEGSGQQARQEQRPINPIEQRNIVATDIAGPIVGGVALKHLQFLFRQMATMFEAGIGPAHTMDVLAKQSTSPKLKRLLIETKDLVTEGHPVSAAFARYPEVFTPVIISMLQISEEGGFIAQQCGQIADYLEDEIALKNLIKRESAYPKIVLIVAVVLIAVVNYVIGSVFEKAGGIDAPLSKASTWYILGPVLIGIWLYTKYYKRSPKIQEKTQGVLFHLPYIGGMVHGFAMAKFGRAFAAMYKSGVPMAKALKLAGQASGNQSVSRRLAPIAGKVDEGAQVSDAMVESGAFTPMVIDLTRTGEMTGNVDKMLIKVAEYYEDQGKTMAKQASVFLGVVALIAVGAYVGYVVVKFYMSYAAGIQAI